MTDQELKDLVASLAIAQAKTEAQVEQTSKKVDKIAEMYGGVANNNGHFAEDTFLRALEEHPQLGDIHFDEIHSHWKGKIPEGEAEFDIVCLNGASVGLVETKYRLHVDDVKKFAEKQIPLFRKIFPTYADKKIYGAVAALSYGEGALEAAKAEGLFALAPEGQDFKLLASDGMPR